MLQIYHRAVAAVRDVPEGEPLTGGPAAAVACCKTAARAIGAVKAWRSSLDAEQQMRVERRLMALKEWYALAVWREAGN